MNAEDVHIETKEKLCLFENGNYIGAFDTLHDIDEYLRTSYKWQCLSDTGGYLMCKFKENRWTISRAEFISYEPN